MKKVCPNENCTAQKKSQNILKSGRYFRRGDSRWVQRYRCRVCQKRFSSSTHTLEYRQRKRRINGPFFKLLTSCVSMRRAAKLLGVSRATVDHRLKYWGEKARLKNVRLLKKVNFCADSFQLDDLITKENSKLKPLTVPITVDPKSYLILGSDVGIIPSFGHLSRISRRKYGYRKCQHRQTLHRLFKNIKQFVPDNPTIVSDKHTNYPPLIRRHFSKAIHHSYESDRATVAGQGELKRNQRDPLFAVNHTSAMFRANINRLVRRTWCTTKCIARLKDHIDLFVYARNKYLLE